MDYEIVWNDSFTIGVEIIDKAPQNLMAIVRRMHTMTHDEDEEKKRKACEEGIKYFKSYAVKRFAKEESYMRSIDYEEYDRHRKDSAQHHAGHCNSRAGASNPVWMKYKNKFRSSLTMPYYATATPGAAAPNQLNTPNQADNVPALPNAPSSANAYAPQINRENTPVAPLTPGLPNEPNTPNEPNDYQAPRLPSPAAPNLPNEPNQPNVPNTPNASLSQGNVPVSANRPNQPNKPNAANIPAVSQGDVLSQNTQENEETAIQSGEGASSRASRLQQSETAAPRPLPSGDSPKNGDGLGIILGAVLLLTAVGFGIWKRKQKHASKTKPEAEPDAAPTSDQDSPETSPKEP